MDIALGVDLGGTKVEAVVLRERRDVVARRRTPTERDRGYDAVLETTAALARAVAEEVGADVATVPMGVGMPGGVTRRGGLVKNSNTVCLNGRPFRDDLARALGRVVGRPSARADEASRAIWFENDANCFALAETLLGALSAHDGGVVFGVILGTGVGGGVVIDGAVWSGAQGIAGEWGHHGPIGSGDRPCYCGQRGCLEQYASGPAVEADYERRAGVRRPLVEIARSRDSDPHAAAAIDTFLDAFGRGLANVIDILDPSAIVVGGGVSNLDLLYTEGRARVARFVFNDELTTPILRHALGDSAGVLGAALLPSAQPARTR